MIKKSTPLLLLRERNRERERSAQAKSNTFISGQQLSKTFRQKEGEEGEIKKIVRGEGACRGCIKSEERADKGKRRRK